MSYDFQYMIKLRICVLVMSQLQIWAATEWILRFHLQILRNKKS
jgi:hypothetical protein